MSEVTTEITGYDSRAAGDGTIHTFTTADGKKYKTWKDDIANEAKTFLNAGLVTISYEVQQNNRNGRVYTDSYINSVVAAGSGGSSAVAGAAPGAAVVFSGAQDRLKALELVIAMTGGDVVAEDPGKAIALADALLEWADTGESPFAGGGEEDE